MAKKIANNALRTAREKLGLSQADIGAKLGITPAAVGHYESGIAKPPVERARQLARMLKIDLAEIPVSARAQRGSRKAAAAGEGKMNPKEAEVLSALRSLPLGKRRPVIEMLLGYVARVKKGG
jgi:transcriptional regulator with XRE-family HTH domain